MEPIAEGAVCIGAARAGGGAALGASGSEGLGFGDGEGHDQLVSPTRWQRQM